MSRPDKSQAPAVSGPTGIEISDDWSEKKKKRYPHIFFAFHNDLK